MQTVLGPELLNEISLFTLRVCTPIYWHDRELAFPKEVQGASCFFLRFKGGVVGITADHVIEAWSAARARTPSIVCQVRFASFDLDSALIDRDKTLDIATFSVSEGELRAIDAVTIDCSGSWPPPVPERMRAASLAGFPKIIRIVHRDQSAEFNAFGALPAVEDVTDSEIIFTYDPARDGPMHGKMPPLGFNLSGCSGGPVLMHGERNGLHRWFPVGLITGGPRGKGTGESGSFDIIRARRIHCVNPDGTLRRASPSGWLPSL
ncbi:hypothetical protein [Lichenifustis flavocetrariae]|uniref:Trypsin-like peptidase domain-containing protein n=1 Tax=Lichenifustis flavocetrariae TaxID=2949735 RepID=A0AA42CMS2_9HYPH|nr:hypothetical protein [Lichenifustis flavocetrariae]MCW6512994.1 hypothetical protein [Lichenifustis flavocetrariae]